MGTLECRMPWSLQRRSEMPTMPLLRLSWDAWRKILEVDRRWRLDQAEFFNAIRRNQSSRLGFDPRRRRKDRRPRLAGLLIWRKGSATAGMRGPTRFPVARAPHDERDGAASASGPRSSSRRARRASCSQRRTWTAIRPTIG